MKKIQLTQGKQALIDNVDFMWISKVKWHFNNGYAARSKWINGKKVRILMHREILKTPKNMHTDHINGNSLDNRKGNLRIATIQQNSFNRKIDVRNKSGYKGLYWNKKLNKWGTKIKLNNKVIYLGTYQDKIAAAQAYNKAASQYQGQFARLNQI